MTSQTRVKICGLRTSEDVAAAADAGVAYVGLVFFPKSPRNVDLQAASHLAQQVPVGIAKTALVVNADNDLLDRITAEVAIDVLQLVEEVEVVQMEQMVKMHIWMVHLMWTLNRAMVAMVQYQQ